MKGHPLGRRHAKTKAVPAAFRLRDKIIVVGAIALCLGVPVLLKQISWYNTVSAEIEKRLVRWRARYRLADEQVGTLREIEHEYHLNSFLSPARTPEEERAHAAKIRASLGGSINPKMLDEDVVLQTAP